MTSPTAAVLSSFSSAVADVVARTRHAIVSVHSHRSQASGFVWKPGLIVTADEALADEGEVSVKLATGTARPARIAGRDHTTDIALLRFEDRDIAPAVFSSVVPDLGSLSVVVAAEHGVPSAALGAISLIGGRWRSLRGGEIAPGSNSTCGCAPATRGARPQCVRRSDRHGRSGGATRSCHSQRDDRPDRGKA
jgi:S1-C subfamily serine protease